MARRQNQTVAVLSDDSPPRSENRREWLAAFALAALTILTFFPALAGGFIWDDDAHLTQNPCIVGPLGFLDIWTSAYARICPLVQSTFWLEYRLWGLEPMPYHLVNILVHAAGAVVLWRVLRALRVPGAWLGATLWAIHPVQVESVAWVTELKNTQSGLFFLLSVLFFCRSRLATHGETGSGRPRLNYVAALVFAVLALASKSSTVVLPLVLGLCAWWIDRGWHWRRNIAELTPVLLLSLVTSLVTVWTQKGEGAFDPDFALSFPERVASAGKVVWFYLGKLAWPDPLIFIYPRWTIDAATVIAWVPAVSIAALMATLWWYRDRWARGAFLTAAYFVAALLPVLGLVDTYFWRYSFVGDHFQYLASMGPLAFAGAGLAIGLRSLGKRHRWLAGAVAAIPLLTLGALSWRQCGVYENDEVLWSTTARLNPGSWMAHNNLAIELARQPGRTAEAITHYKEALRLRPDHAKAHYNLAVELMKLPARRDDAIDHLQKALQFDPTLGLAHKNLGALLAVSPGQEAEAIAHFEEALRLMPDSAETHYNLAIQLQKLPGRESKAITHYRSAMQLRPDFAEAHYNLALALAVQTDGQEEAAAHFESALKSRPEWPEALHGYAILLSRMPGRTEESIAQFEEALRLKPDDPIIHFNLAGTFYRIGRVSDARRHLEAALAIDPEFEAARRRLEALRLESRR